MKYLTLLIFVATGLGAAFTHQHNPPDPPHETMKLVVDTERSVIHWRGTKFWGAGKHEGVVRLSSGAIAVRNGTIDAGRFVIDMTTIEVTDIPESDPVPRNRLRRHLLEEDFFFVDRYPTAVFEINGVRHLERSQYLVTGRLTMRGVTRELHFEAHVPTLRNDAVRATAQFSINRHRWGIAFRGSRLTNDLVDDEIHLQLLLVANGAGDA